jgi:arginine decarboxylase
MDIPVVAAVGRGPTELAAFDAALVAAGIADRNLIYRSSVLPPGSRPHRVPRLTGTPGGWGDRLYCVMAQQRTSTPGAQAWAGVGWVRDTTGRGLLVEHEAEDEATLRATVAASLEALVANRGGVDLPQSDLVVSGAVCDGTPVCALVVAVFEAASWQSLPAGSLRQRAPLAAGLPG